MPTQREKATTHEPMANDWLYACPTGMPTPQIVTLLNIAGQPVTEVSARDWQQEWQMANDLMDAYGYRESYRWQLGQPVGWDSLNDWILIKQWQRGSVVLGSITGSQFAGELVVIRQSQYASEDVLAFLLDVIQAHVRRSLQLHSQARIVVVLEGWDRLVIEGRVGKGRVGRRVGWMVNPMPSA